MVMIPVGNNTRHNFSLWSILEVYVRICISALLVSVVYGRNPDLYWYTIIIFTTWSWRPLYIQIQYIYRSWIESKHEAESEALKRKRK